MKKYKSCIKSYFTNIFFLLLALLFISCGDLDKSKSEKNVDSLSEEIVDTVAEEPASILTAPRKIVKAHTGDFDMMLKRRIVRVLVPHSRTLFFIDKGKERGLSAAIAREFEMFINQKYRRKLHNRPITVVIIPTARDKLIPNVANGFGDIAAGNLTVTKERLSQVDFTAPPEVGSVSEIVLTHRQSSPVTNLEMLSGRTVHVRASSSYHESLLKLNKVFERKNKAQVKIVKVSEFLEDEDLMEMLDAGIISTIVVDNWKAKMWAQILPNIKLNTDAAVRRGGHIGWGYRKNSPLLAAELKEFYYKFEKLRGSIPYRLEKYNEQVKRLQDPTKSSSWERYQKTIKLFEKYGKQYGFDPMMLAAQGFQESKLNQSVRSRVGAIGIMQLMPKTGASMKVGDITNTEPNIHAGTKYMSIIMTRYFQDSQFDNFNKPLFAFASYNAGPNRIARLRKVAADRGLNPDVWLKNVEIVVSEKVGRETTTYVRNIVKYYYSYKLMNEFIEGKRKAREKFGLMDRKELYFYSSL